jgi:Ca2+-transporting ATPase
MPAETTPADASSEERPVPEDVQVETPDRLDRPPHALDGREVAQAFEVDPDRGLDGDEVARRREEYGENSLPSAPERPKWKLLLDQFRNVLILVLLGAAALSAFVGDVKDAIVIAAVLTLNAVIGFVQELRAEASVEALKQMIHTTARVRRDGRVVEVDAEELVPGDVVLLDAGDRAPADGRLLMASTLELDESALTGESLPAAKDARTDVDEDVGLGDRPTMIHMQSAVTRGRGEMVVTATGSRTAIGQIAGMLSETEERRTPLQQQVDVLGKRLAMVAGGAVVAYAVVGLLTGSDWNEVLLTAVALAAAAIPEGLPAVLAVTLAVGMRVLARANAVVKKMAAVETLGSTTVVCTDKTGTLTEHQLTVVSTWRGDHHDTTPGDEPTDSTLLLGGVLCNDAEVDDEREVGDPTDVAFVRWARDRDLDVDALRDEHERLAQLPFSSEQRFMATVNAIDGTHRLLLKGAPETVLERCRTVAGEDADDMADEVRAAIDRFAEQGQRVLAVASRDLADGDDPDDVVQDPDGLDLVGMVGLVDPPREQASHAVDTARSAGVRVVMLTGDHRETAAAIGREVGIEGEAIVGRDIDDVSDEELPATLHDVGVVARVEPEHKLRIVQALQADGEVVGMTGDGVNDGPALKAADIGIAMGITGTEVAKEAATMILSDDNFATIIRAIERGRGIYENILTFLRFQLTTSFGAVLTVLAAPLLGLAAPLTALQVLFVNLIADGPPAMALGLDPARDGLMDDPPRRPGSALLPTRRLAWLAGTAVWMAGVTLGMFVWAGGARSDDVAGTMAFTTFVMLQVVNVLNVRSERDTALRRRNDPNWWLAGAIGGVVVLQVLVVHVPALQSLFDTVPLSATDWLLSIGAGASVLVFDEVRKLIRRTVSPVKHEGTV